MNVRELTAEIGQSMMTPSQGRYATLPNILSTFTATGLSESERLEFAHMLQRFIVEGYLKGINVPGLMKAREKIEGMLHVGFFDDWTPSRNTVLFDRGTWRTASMPQRLNDFVNKIGTRLASRIDHSQPPRNNYAVRHTYGRQPVTGPLRRTFKQLEIDKIARQIGQVVLPRVTAKVFEGLQTIQKQLNIAAPMQMSAPTLSMPLPKVPDWGDANQTREDILLSGAKTDLQLQGMPARSGIASPRSPAGPQMLPAMQAGGRPQKALIFTGSGTWSSEISAIKNNLDSLGIGYETTSNLSGVDYSGYGAIIFPGGQATTQYNAIGSYEASRLKEAIGGGLNYYGACAGAFLAGEYGSWGLGIIDEALNYPSQVYYGGGGQVETNMNLKWGNDPSQGILFYGGPGLEGVGTTLAEFDSGEDSIVSTDYGSGHIILSAGHPGVEGPGDQDGADDQVLRDLLSAVVQGTDPGKSTPTTPGTPGTPTGNNKVINSTTNNYEIPSPSVNPYSGSSTMFGASGGAQRAPFRKTPVAGMLPTNIVQPVFSAQLQDIMGQSAPMLQGMAGMLTGGRR